MSCIFVPIPYPPKHKPSHNEVSMIYIFTTITTGLQAHTLVYEFVLCILFDFTFRDALCFSWTENTSRQVPRKTDSCHFILLDASLKT